MKIIMENWKKFINENNEMQQRLYDLTGKYLDKYEERLQDISWKVHDMMYPRDPSAKPIGIKDLNLKGDEAEFARELYALNRELKRGSLKEARLVIPQGAQNTVKEVAKVNTRLMSRIMATRDSAARQGRWDLVDACAALLERNKQGEYNFRAFEGQLESAFASSSPGETLNAAADAIMDSYRKLGRKSTVNESASPSMERHAKIAGELVDAVNKFGFRKLSNNDHSQLRNLLGDLRDKSPIDARDSIIDFLVGKRLANRSLFYNIR